jgi:hypothetical protein
MKSKLFDRVVVISLARRKDRLDSFLKKYPASFPSPVVYDAVDGSVEKPPQWWNRSPGAWGCALSHSNVFKSAVEDSLDSILVFEDDCGFVPDFDSRFRTIEIPDDCQCLYLGGRIKPQNGFRHFSEDLVLVQKTIVRMHAYAVFGSSTIKMISDHIDMGEHWRHPGAIHHVDAHLSEFLTKNTMKTYAIRPWLCMQLAGYSDIERRKFPDRKWSL